MNERSERTNRVLANVFLVLAIIGFIDSLYLAIAYSTDTELSCAFLSGCNEVAQSPYSSIAGVSLPFLGLLYYFFSITNALYYLATHRLAAATMLAYLGTLGFLASLYFTFLQAFVIKAFCIYCLISAGTATFLFIIGIVIRKRHIRLHITNEHESAH